MAMIPLGDTQLVVQTFNFFVWREETNLAPAFVVIRRYLDDESHHRSPLTRHLNTKPPDL